MSSCRLHLIAAGFLLASTLSAAEHIHPDDVRIQGNALTIDNSVTGADTTELRLWPDNGNNFTLASHNVAGGFVLYDQTNLATRWQVTNAGNTIINGHVKLNTAAGTCTFGDGGTSNHINHAVGGNTVIREAGVNKVIVGSDVSVQTNLGINGALWHTGNASWYMPDAAGTAQQFASIVSEAENAVLDLGRTDVQTTPAIDLRAGYHSGYDVRLAANNGDAATPGRGILNVYAATTNFWSNIHVQDENGVLKVAKVQAGEVQVKPEWWADYVFADDYQLPTLDAVAEHIREHKHLPGVPSEAEVLDQGLDIADMMAVHMAKIEELTLYTLQQQDLIERQQSELEQMRAVVEQQSALLSRALKQLDVQR